MTKNRSMNDVLFEHLNCYRYEVDEDQDNLLFPFYLYKGNSVSNEYNCRFSFTEDKHIQAGIIYKERIIFMTYGMFDGLCKLSELMVSSGIFDQRLKGTEGLKINQS